MKRFFTVLIVVLLLPVFTEASNQKVDLLLKHIQKSPKASSTLVGKSVKNVGGVSFVNILVKTNAKDKTINTIKKLGGKVIFSLRTVIGAEIPISAIGVLAKNDEVVYIEADRLLKEKMNDARVATKANTVNSEGYTGKGVVVGVVDDGIDYTHPNFEGADGTRFKYIEWSSASGSNLGSCTSEDIDADSCDLTLGQGTDGDPTYHGTHVTGIAAGSSGTYTGVAPESDIIFYRSWGDGDSDGSMATSVIAGVDTIFKKATELKEAAVVNLSLGTSIGAHDGTSVLEEGLDELVEDDSGNLLPGRIIVNAAGNENTTKNYSDIGYGGIHAGFTLADGEAKGYRAFVNTPEDAGALYVDVWVRDGSLDGCEISAYAFHDATNPIPASGVASVPSAWLDFNEDEKSYSNSDVRITISKNGDESKPRAFVSIEDVSGKWNEYSYVVAIKSVDGSCIGDMWLYPDQIAYNIFQKSIDASVNNTYNFGYANGDPFKTLTIPSTAKNVIAVGAYFQSKPYGDNTSEWTNINGDLESEGEGPTNPYGSYLNDMAGFSSLGPTGSGAPKPDVVAPGEPIISSITRGVSLTEKYMISNGYAVSSGTSMSSPHVAGIVALLLQKNTCLTVDTVREALKTGTSKTGLTAASGSDAANTFGSGKVNAKNAIDSVSVPAEQCHQGGGNIDGSGGCGGSIAPVTNQTAGLIVSLFAISSVLMLIWRKRKTE